MRGEELSPHASSTAFPEKARIASLIGTRDARAKRALGNGSRAKSTHSQQSKRGGQKQQGGPEPDDPTNTITLS